MFCPEHFKKQIDTIKTNIIIAPKEILKVKLNSNRLNIERILKKNLELIQKMDLNNKLKIIKLIELENFSRQNRFEDILSCDYFKNIIKNLEKKVEIYGQEISLLRLLGEIYFYKKKNNLTFDDSINYFLQNCEKYNEINLEESIIKSQNLIECLVPKKLKIVNTNYQKFECNFTRFLNYFFREFKYSNKIKSLIETKINFNGEYYFEILKSMSDYYFFQQKPIYKSKEELDKIVKKNNLFSLLKKIFSHSIKFKTIYDSKIKRAKIIGISKNGSKFYFENCYGVWDNLEVFYIENNYELSLTELKKIELLFECSKVNFHNLCSEFTPKIKYIKEFFDKNKVENFTKLDNKLFFNNLEFMKFYNSNYYSEGYSQGYKKFITNYFECESLSEEEIELIDFIFNINGNIKNNNLSININKFRYIINIKSSNVFIPYFDKKQRFDKNPFYLEIYKKVEKLFEKKKQS